MQRQRLTIALVILLFGLGVLVGQPAGVTTARNKGIAQTQKVIAVSGRALILNETNDGVTTTPVLTQRAVDSAFGFAPDGLTVAYSALNENGQPVAGLYLDDTATGSARQVSEKVVFAAQWSPAQDGKLAYTFADGEGFGVAVYDTTSGLETILVRDQVLPEVIGWGERGDSVYYLQARQESQLVYRRSNDAPPVQERPYTVITARVIPVSDPHQAREAADEMPRVLPSLKRPVRSGEFAAPVDTEAPALPSDLYAFRRTTDSGEVEIIGENLLGVGAISIRAGPRGEVTLLGRGKLVSTLEKGIILREYNATGSELKYVTWDGRETLLEVAAVTHNLPFASAVMTQGGSGYSSPGDCSLYDHYGSHAYAYDFQSSVSGAHVLATAAGLVVYSKSDVLCNSCDKDDCDHYPCPSDGSNGGWGNALIIKHADSEYTKYTHLEANSPQVAVGTNVCQGQYIGRQGHTGCSIGNMNGCGDHLHFERQTTPGLSDSSAELTFADTTTNPLSCGVTYSSGSMEVTSCSGCIASVPAERWKGEYFNNRALTGSPAMVRDDGTGSINFDWGGGSPSSACGLGVDNFSARWTRMVNFTAGTYRFSVTGDDGIKLYVNGQLKIDKWIDQAPTTYTADVVLSAGNHNLKLEFYENGGGAVARLSWAAVSSGGCIASVPAERWKGEYFNNRALTGSPAMVRDDGTGSINFDWGGGSPSSACGLGVDNFSARWTRMVNFTAGTYRFSVTGDDGIKLYVNGQLKIDKWIDQAPTTYTADVALSAGNHELKLEFYENGGGAVARLSWAAVSSPAPVISSISPSTPTASASNQDMIVNGSNFQPNLTVGVFFPGNSGATPDVTLSGSQILNVTANSFTMRTTLGSTGTWGIRVNNPDGQQSSRFNFTVVSGSNCIASVSSANWKGEYFNNRTLTGSPVMVRNDGTGSINFDWGGGSPSSACGLGVDNFSARWTRMVNFTAGTYRFSVTGDDGIKLYVNGQLKIDKWIDQAPTTYTADVALSAGNHELKLEFYENGGGAVARLSWAAVSSPAPLISSISPSTVTVNQTTTLTVNGSNFQSGLSAAVITSGGTFPIASTGLTFVSSTQVRVQVAMGGAAPYLATLRIANPDGQTATGNFQVAAATPPAPSISSISPSTVTVNQTTTLTVNGSNFQSGFSAAVITSGGTFPIASAGLTFVSSTQVRVQVTMGGAAPYSATLRITNPDGQSATISFQVAAAAPTISSISPSTVTRNVATTLTVNGSNFQSGFSAAVITSSGTFPIASAGLTFVSSTQVRVQVTMGGSGPYSATLRITNPDGQSASSTFQVQ